MYALKIIRKYILNLKIYFLFLFIFSTISSLFNALSAVSLIPIVSLLLGENVNLKIGKFLEKHEIINITEYGHLELIIFFLIFFVIGGFFKIISDYLIIKIRVIILSLYFKDLLNRFFLSNWHFFYLNDIGKISNSVYKELDKVGGSIIAILHLFSNVFLISIILLIPIFVSFHVTIVSTLVILGLFLPVKLINFYFYKLGKRFTDESNIFSKLFFYAVSMYKNISANSANKITIDDIHNSYKKINKFEIINKLLNSSISEVLNTLSIFFVFTIFTISSYYNLSIPEISAVLYSFLRIFPHVNNSISMINVIQSSRAGFELIENLKRKSTEINEEWGSLKFENLEKISVDNLNYSYPNGKNALTDIEIDIKNGEMVAIVGQSGSGKSTILDLLAGLNFTKSGKIFLNDKNLYDYDRKSYQSLVGYVDSNIDLFPYTIKKNISMFCNNVKDEDLKKIYSFVNLDKVINNLPEKDNTILGDKGSTLSSGQKQRICIARALIKKPKIIIFDEATNYLDDKNEEIILQNLSTLKHGSLILFATHKKSILKYFDRVIFFKDGKIENIK